MNTVFDESNKYIVSLNISVEKGTIKKPVDFVEIYEEGIIGDAHSGKWHRQISMLAQEDIERFSVLEAREREFAPGEFAENITTKGIDYKKVSILDRFIIGDVILEVSQIGKKCHGDGCAIYVEVGKCVMPKSGIFTRVVKGGTIKTNDAIVYEPKPIKIKIITLSDRAKAGEYKDLSGPEIKKYLEEFFINKRWHIEYDYALISDDKNDLLNELNSAKEKDFNFVFTTGGTGISPRDITPEVVLEFADKEIPGIMEAIRLKYYETIPSSVLSRSVTAIKDKMIIYTLPGSVKAVKEYLSEITKTIEHAILMINDIKH